MDDLAFAAAVRLVDFGRFWLVGGLVVATAFLGFGLDRVAPSARGAWAFRPLLVPGLLLLWPIVLWRWATLERGRESASGAPWRAHPVVWTALAAILPAILVAALLHRAPREAPAALRLDLSPAASPASGGAAP